MRNRLVSRQAQASRNLPRGGNHDAGAGFHHCIQYISDVAYISDCDARHSVANKRPVSDPDPWSRIAVITVTPQAPGPPVVWKAPPRTPWHFSPGDAFGHAIS